MTNSDLILVGFGAFSVKSLLKKREKKSEKEIILKKIEKDKREKEREREEEKEKKRKRKREREKEREKERETEIGFIGIKLPLYFVYKVIS